MGLVTPGPVTFGALLSLRNIKYTIMHHFQKKNSKKILPRGAPQNVWGAAKMFPRAPLWLSTGLARHDLKSALLAD